MPMTDDAMIAAVDRVHGESESARSEVEDDGLIGTQLDRDIRNASTVSGTKSNVATIQ